MYNTWAQTDYGCNDVALELEAVSKTNATRDITLVGRLCTVAGKVIVEKQTPLCQLFKHHVLIDCVGHPLSTGSLNLLLNLWGD